VLLLESSEIVWISIDKCHNQLTFLKVRHLMSPRWLE
jgi:hypothetical protein